MNRRTKTITAATAGVALTLGVVGTAVAVTNNNDSTPAVTVEEAVEIPTTTMAFFGTTMEVPANVVAFYLSDTLQTAGDGSAITAETAADIQTQLEAAPEQSVLFLDTNSIESDGLSTALLTVTPTNGLNLGNTNDEIGAWMQGLFTDPNGTFGSWYIEAVPNAFFRTTQVTDDITWNVTDYLAQHPDAVLSLKASSTEENAEAFQAQIEAMITGFTRG